MTRKPTIILLFALLGFFSTPSAWCRPVSGTAATVTATVVEDLAITSEEPLNFGFVTPSSQGGTVVISPDNTRSATGGVQTAAAFNRAAFAVRGTPGHSYAIHAPSSLTFLVKEGNEDKKSKHLIHELTVKDFVTYSVTIGTAAATGKLGQNGQDKIYLGATLVVPSDAAPGIYSGWVPLTVSY
jgi:hypothetical protein